MNDDIASVVVVAPNLSHADNIVRRRILVHKVSDRSFSNLALEIAKSMKLSFERPYLSIQSFPTVELPPFTLLTGVNGAGKTHLLKAINAGRIRVDIAPKPDEMVRLFDWTNLAPQDSGAFQTASVYTHREQILSLARQEREKIIDPISMWRLKYGLVGIVSPNVFDIMQIREPDLVSLFDDQEAGKQAWSELYGIAIGGINNMKSNASSNPRVMEQINDLEQKLGLGVLSLSERDFEDDAVGWGQVDLFQQSFAQLFMTYFEAMRLNKLRRLDQAEGNEPSVPPLNGEEFEQRFGPLPWDFVNQILAESRLDFQIDHPVELSTQSFTPKLLKTTSGAEVKFNELSSGERILMSFAFCLYNSRDDRQHFKRPNLLLFDEIDAPLHPSMSRKLVDTIRSTLVEGNGINVILATHAPATVAVSPEEAVHVMLPDQAGIHRVSKRQAIATLTSEIPTLSIDYDGRRQVFVESRHDAARYEKLFRYLSPLISSERSLAFVAVGKRKEKGEDAGGCSHVRQIVGDLVANGNDSVFGLIDWDLKNRGDDRVIVIAENNRYAIENCILDPLLVGALLAHVNRETALEVGLAPDKGYKDFGSLSPDECQIIIDGVERRVFGLAESDSLGDKMRVEYVGGYSALVSDSYLKMQGHDLEGVLKDTFPPLRRFQNENQVMMEIIDPVIFENRNLVPKEIIDSFVRILDFDPVESGSSQAR